MHLLLLQLSSESKQEALVRTPLRWTHTGRDLLHLSKSKTQQQNPRGPRQPLPQVSESQPLQQLENAVPLPSGGWDPPRYPKGRMVPNLQGALCIHFLIEHQKSKADHTIKKPLEPLPSPGQLVPRPSDPHISHVMVDFCSISIAPTTFEDVYGLPTLLPSVYCPCTEMGQNRLHLGIRFFLNFQKKISMWLFLGAFYLEDLTNI